MTLIAERFLADEDGVVDLATGESIRLTIDRLERRTHDRAGPCDVLFGLRHPLLLPLVDYGVIGEHWFEAHAHLPTLRVPPLQSRPCALHLVRFLRHAGVALDAAAAARNVRTAGESSGVRWRPLGVTLQARSALDSIRTVLEGMGPPGVTTIVVQAAAGCGLRTARLQIARIARQAGYLVMDSRFGALPVAMTLARHLCVFDWLSRSTALPAALALAEAGGGRRHTWIRFCREPARSAGAIGLEPLMTRDLMSAIYLDPELGPTSAEVRCALATAGGNPGALVAALSRSRATGREQVGWVHESTPDYATTRTATPVTQHAGVARLQRAVQGAVTLAERGRHGRAIRVLRRTMEALGVRGAHVAAASAAVHCGELLLQRGRLDEAAAAFEQSLQCCPEGETAARALVGAGRVLLERGRLLEAEGPLRRALCAGDPFWAARARWHLCEALILRGKLDAAEEIAGTADAVALCTIRRLQGNLAEAGRAAAAAIAERATGAVRVCEALLAAARVAVEIGDRDAARKHLTRAADAARRSHVRSLRLRVAAERYAALTRPGERGATSARERLVRASRAMTPLSGALVRIVLNAAAPDDRSLIAVPRDNAHLIHHFHALLRAIQDAPDEATAVQAIATDMLRALEACSAVIGARGPSGIVAGAGRPWPAAIELVQRVLDGAGFTFRNGLTPDAAEPVTIGESIVGVIAIRWLPDMRPPLERVRDVLRTAAAALAAPLKAITTPKIVDTTAYPDELLGPGPAAERVRDAIRRAALAPFPVLIEGESGSGKELVARSIHARSARRARRFCALNCAALSDDLLEAELFGHARGAFTGAVAERPGLFEEADQGTIFLDEAGELSARAQAKLLRVLQDGEVRRVGENLPRKVDARVVAATNRSLEEEVKCGRFRADLRFRLDVVRITVPPLRERADVVPHLARRIWTETAARVGTRAILSDEVLASLARYDWPGNVRELQNVIAALAVHGPRRGRVSVAALPSHIARLAGQAQEGFGEARLEFERRYVRAALARAAWNRRLAAEQLGVSRQGLEKIMRRLGIVESTA
jgi:DNA-binding NtrC family response regulator